MSHLFENSREEIQACDWPISSHLHPLTHLIGPLFAMNLKFFKSLWCQKVCCSFEHHKSSVKILFLELTGRKTQPASNRVPFCETCTGIIYLGEPCTVAHRARVAVVATGEVPNGATRAMYWSAFIQFFAFFGPFHSSASNHDDFVSDFSYSGYLTCYHNDFYAIQNHIATINFPLRGTCYMQRT